MGVIDKWRVIVHTDWFYKIEHRVGTLEMAKEYAERILVRGAYFKDDRGVITYIPIQRIYKVKIVPPNVELDSTETLVG